METSKKLFVIENENQIKINELCIKFSMNKSQVINKAIESFSYDLKQKLVVEHNKKSMLLNEMDMVDEEINCINAQIERDKLAVEVIEKERNRFRKIIKAKFKKGEDLEGLKIAKRMAWDLECKYTELLPNKTK